MNALQRLTVLTRKLDSPWLLCGDFNTSAESWIDRDDSVVCPKPAHPTYPAHEPVEEIDYCVASRGLHVVGKVLAVEGSDHLPVVVWVGVAG
jgi:endonuclease/exonuclease/phosphatase family metal-dependent hydrolase